MNCKTKTLGNSSTINNEIFLPATPNDVDKYYHLRRCPYFIFTHNRCNSYPTLYLDDKLYCCGC